MGNVYNRKPKTTRNQKTKRQRTSNCHLRPVRKVPRGTDTGTPNGPSGGANVSCGREEPHMPVEPLVCQDERPQIFTPFPIIQFGFELNSPAGQPWLSKIEQA